MGKKGRKGADDWEKDFDALDEDGNLKEPVEGGADEAAAAPAAAKKKEKKGKKGKAKGKAAAAFADSEDDEPGLPALAAAPSEEGEEEEEEEEAPPVNQTRQKGGKKKKGGAPAGGSVFALLNGDGSEAEEEEEEEEEEEAEDEEEAPARKAPAMVVAEVLSVAPHPKADRLRVCQVDAGGAATLKVVTNAASVEEGMKVVFAPVGCVTANGTKVEQAVLRGVESYGMLCSAHECGWVSEPDGVLVVMPDDAEVGEECPEDPPEGAVYGKAAAKKEKKKEKKKKGVADADSLFAALAGSGGEEEGGEEEEEAREHKHKHKHKKEKKEKKKKEGGDIGSAFAALALDGEAEEAEEEEEEAPAPKSKKEKKKKAVADAGSLFAALGGEDAEEQEEEEVEEAPKKKKKDKKAAAAEAADLFAALGGEEPAEAPAPAAAGGKKEKKKAKKGGKGGAAQEEEEDLDALLAELGDVPAPKPSEPAPAAAAAAAGGKKDKKKKKGGKGGAKEEEEEDLDALLAELGAVPAQQAAPAATPAERPDTPEAGGDGEDGEDGEGEGGKEMSAAAKKKAKRKAKEAAKKAAAGGGGEGEGEAAAAADGEEAAGEGKGGKGKKGGAPKVSAAVRRMQEALEAQRKAQEEAERLAEEQRIREEEEERQREEEEARKKEESERRRKEKAERREQLKKEGKLLTGKAKEEAERRARAAQQFLKQAGLNPDELPKKKPVYGAKKKPQKKKAEDAAAAADAAPADETAAAAPAAEQPPAAEAAAAAEEAAAETGGDSWEDAADDWEAMDVDAIQVPQVAKEDEEDEEEEQPAPKAAAANGKAQAATAARDKAAAAVKAAADELAAAKAAVEAEGSESEEDSSSEEGSSSEEDSSDEDSSDYSSSEEDSDSDSDDERERRLAAARDRREAKLAAALAARDPADLRSPICCILGHVDTGKTKILDNIRRTNVQDGEAGGITQQIGATYIPASAVEKRTEDLRKGRQFDLKLPGLLVIDTPGHESFSNLRSRGSGLCDIAILVVDLMHGLEQQTIESINLLKMRKTPFIIAVNKVDRLFKWDSLPNGPILDSLARQDPDTMAEFDSRLAKMSLELNEQGLNVSLYWKNKDPRTYVNMVPTSAITGEGIPDLLQLVVKLTQSLMAERLMFVNNLECTVLEVKQIEGLGTTIDVVLVNGMLKEGDTIVVCGLGGPIVTNIRALLTPQPLKEIRVKGSYVHHKELRAAMGVKIAAHNLESAVAGTQLYVVGPDEDVEDLKDAVMEDMQDIFSSVDKTGEGVCVQASTLGSLEALLEFLRSPAVQIPVSSINIGPINKKDVMRANAMIERGYKKFGVILAFDVPVTRDAGALAEQLGVRVFTADIIYHLFDQFTAYLEKVKLEEQEAAKLTAVFPCVLKIIPTCIFNQKDPIILGVEVVEGIAKVGTPICVPTRGGVDLGRISSLEKDHKAVNEARKGDAVAMKIEATKPEEASRSYERHFDHRDELVSRITRKSINVLKEMFADEMTKDDWRLVLKLKRVFKID